MAVVVVLGVLVALPAQAQAQIVPIRIEQQYQVGGAIGLGVSVGPKGERRSRFHPVVQVFAELAHAPEGLNPGRVATPFSIEQQNSLVPGLSATLRWRDGAEVELAGRFGIARTSDPYSLRHGTIARGSIEAGLVWIHNERALAALGGLEVRVFMVQVRNRFRSGEWQETLDITGVSGIGPKRPRSLLQTLDGPGGGQGLK
tara:strand:- start:73 stop:675 length:603 start_codon:yes stop_codon:yes gene_type:complete